MNCPQCGFDNPAGAVRCAKCDAALAPGGAAAAVNRSVTAAATAPAADVTRDLLLLAVRPGQVLGGRYEILRLLGEGGMGAVYKARDLALDRVVALKVIRPEYASHPEILRRFKQELILARQVTHKNVIRIFDLGEADGIKFITMDYIDGQDLKTLLRQKGKFAPEEAAGIIQQVCRALAAAHAEGVVHRDLKPQNVMVDTQGNVAVMDFGIARSLEMPGMTQTGALMGTPDYMSPEQARGERLDARTDIFSLGIIFYELLTGKSPYAADTALSALWKRTQERARPPTELDPAIPSALSNVVMRCLEMDRERRYSSAKQILQELEARRRPRGEAQPAPATAVPAGAATSDGSAAAAPALVAPGQGVPVGATRPARRKWVWVVAGLTAALLAAGGVLLRDRIFPTTPARHAPVTLLIADFDNQTLDPVFDGTLEPMMGVALEGASFISSYNRGAARRVAAQLRPDARRLDEAVARLVAVREGISVVVPGAIARAGAGYTVSVKAVDAATGNTLVQSEEQASKKEYVLSAAGKLAASIRKALGDTAPGSAQLAAAETFSTASLEAAHSYALGQDLQMTGKWEQAIAQYAHAVQLDPEFGRAYAGLAAMYANLGQRQEADKYYRTALARLDRMSEREKFRTRGGYYLMTRNQQKAIEEFAALVNLFPADTAGYANLALAHFYGRDMAKALEVGRRAVEISPRSALQRNNVALYALYAGDFPTAAREAQAALEINPEFEKAYAARALAELGQGQPAQAAQTYKRLEATSARGASMAAAGAADLALFQGRIENAVELLEKGIAGDLATNNTAAAAAKLATLGAAELLRGRVLQALAAADRAAGSSKGEEVLYDAARVYIEAGQESRARALAAQLAARAEPEPQLYAKLLEGEIQLKRGNAQQALALFQEAHRQADTWLGHVALGRAYLAAGAFAEAASEFEGCLKRRGEATSVFLDDAPTYHLFPAVYYYLGRAQEGLRNPGAAESYRAFLALKDKDSAEPQVADARRRLP